MGLFLSLFCTCYFYFHPDFLRQVPAPPTSEEKIVTPELSFSCLGSITNVAKSGLKPKPALQRPMFLPLHQRLSSEERTMERMPLAHLREWDTVSVGGFPSQKSRCLWWFIFRSCSLRVEEDICKRLVLASESYKQGSQENQPTRWWESQRSWQPPVFHTAKMSALAETPFPLPGQAW